MASPAVAGEARQVADINQVPVEPRAVGEERLASVARGWVAVGGVTYFAADDGVRGLELWRTEGTPRSTALVRDIFPGQRGSGIRDLVEFDGALYFGAADLEHGCGLWRSDGTAAGTTLVSLFGRLRRCNQGGGGTSDLTVVGDQLLFSASEGAHDSQLWRSDGTAAGTVRVANSDAPSNPPGTGGSVAPSLITSLGTVAVFRVFSSEQPTSREASLWRSDGSAAGTFPIHAAQPYPTTAEQDRFTRLGDIAFFAVIGAGNVLELWRTDGSDAGTFPLGTLFRERNPRVATWNGRAYFFSQMQSVPPRVGLWCTDGTVAGTRPVVLDILEAVVPGRILAGPGEIESSEHSLFFTLGSASRLWASNATADGTRAVTGGSDGTKPIEAQRLAAFGDQVGFVATDPESGCALWFTDGSAAGTRAVADLAPGPAPCPLPAQFETVPPAALHASNDTFVFLADDELHGIEPWVTDGTREGTQLLRDIDAGAERSRDANPALMTALDSVLVFAANDGSHDALYGAGAAGPAVRLSMDPIGGVCTGARLGQLAIYFVTSRNGIALWRSDGSPQGTNALTTIAMIGCPIWTKAAGDNLFFFVPRGAAYELWRTDGTAAGTVRLIGFDSPGTLLASMPGRFLLFSATTTAHGTELWRSDGSEAGTVLVRDIRPGPASGVTVTGSLNVVIDGAAVFIANDGEHGDELWRSDGTPNGTTLVSDIVEGPAGLLGSFAWAEAAQSFYVYFIRDDDMFACRQRELWVSDGSSAGTRFLAAIPLGGCYGSPTPIIAAAGQVFFIGADGDAGAELWHSDGTMAGTARVTDIRPGSASGLVLDGSRRWAHLYSVGRYAVFLADDGANGIEVWSSDGTSAGTRMLTDFDPRLADGVHTHGGFVPLGDRLVFFAFEPSTGFEPWITDGTPAGTRLLADIAPGPLSSFPASSHMPVDDSPIPTLAARVGDRLFLVADDASSGRELWNVGLAESGAACGGDCDGGGSVSVDELVRGVRIALGTTPAGLCASLDANRDGTVGINELIAAVATLLTGCPASPDGS